MPFPQNLTKKWGKEVGWECMVCGRKWTDGWLLEAHHIIPTHNGGKNIRENWILLCVEHHEEAHRELARKDSYSADLIHRRLEKKKGRWR